MVFGRISYPLRTEMVFHRTVLERLERSFLAMAMEIYVSGVSAEPIWKAYIHACSRASNTNPIRPQIPKIG